MIDLLCGTDRRAFGVRTLLDLEGIPYRFIVRAEEFAGRMLVIATDRLDAGALALARKVPTLVIGAPEALVRDRFEGTVRFAGETAVTMPLDDTLWPAGVRAQAARFGKSALSLPHAPVFVAAPRAASVLATRLSGGDRLPVVLRQGTCWWCFVDIGSAFADLLDEAYWEQPGERRRRIPRSILWLYYHAPEVLRRLLQHRTYARLERARAARGETSAEYPVDATGWLTVELMKALVRTVAGGLVRVGRWPAPYAAAATLTHDLEPTRFAYTQGLERLLRRVERGGPPATFGVVARPAARYLHGETAARIGHHAVLCHGTEHRGETVVGNTGDVMGELRRARQLLHTQLGRPIEGFRSPRLDRSSTLLAALHHVGVAWDSSYPDVDRENTRGFGGGVRLNLPFRPPVLTEGGVIRGSACLELPVSAPDCIQPLFQGATPGALGRAVTEKLDFVEATGGLYVGIVHAGVFGPRDGARRGAHLGFVRRRLARESFWVTTADDIAAWWRARERIEVSVVEGVATVVNHARQVVEGLRLIVERSDGEESVHEIAALPAGGWATIPLDGWRREAWR